MSKKSLFSSNCGCCFKTCQIGLTESDLADRFGFILVEHTPVQLIGSFGKKRTH